jgi:hypothetical protein
MVCKGFCAALSLAWIEQAWAVVSCFESQQVARGKCSSFCFAICFSERIRPAGHAYVRPQVLLLPATICVAGSLHEIRVILVVMHQRTCCIVSDFRVPQFPDCPKRSLAKGKWTYVRLRGIPVDWSLIGHQMFRVLVNHGDRQALHLLKHPHSCLLSGKNLRWTLS